MIPTHEKSYEMLMKHYNKSVERVTCSCGKQVSKNILEKHQQTKLHERLSRYLKHAVPQKV
jgi:hypothetical protein